MALSFRGWCRQNPDGDRHGYAQYLNGLARAARLANTGYTDPFSQLASELSSAAAEARNIRDRLAAMEANPGRDEHALREDNQALLQAEVRLREYFIRAAAVYREQFPEEGAALHLSQD